MSKKTLIISLVILSLVLASCAPANNPQPATSASEADTTESQKTEAPAPVESETPTLQEIQVQPQPQPVPTPPPTKVELFGFIAQAWGSYALANNIKTYEEALKSFEQFGAMKLKIGDREYPIKATLQSFTADDWKEIDAVGKYISQQRASEESGEDASGDPNTEEGIREIAGTTGTSAAAAAIMVGRCRTTCLAVFEELWYACAHLATGANWIRIDEGYMSSHPDPVLCGHRVNWERLVDVLENCPGYSVAYAGSSILIRKLQKKNDSRYEFAYNSADVATVALVVAGVATVGVVVGVIVIASGGSAAPIFALVLLVP